MQNQRHLAKSLAADDDGPRDRSLATEAQMRLLVAFWELKNENDGCPPTLSELAGRLGMSSASGPQFALEALCKKGYLTNAGKKARCYVMTAKGRTAAQEASGR